MIIGEIRNSKKKGDTFRQQHLADIIQRRLDYFLVSNNLQESVNKTDILTVLSTDHSLILFHCLKIKIYQEVKGYGNLTTLCHKLDFFVELKNHLKVICNRMSAEQITWLTTVLGVCIIWNKNIVTLDDKLKPWIRTEVEQNPNCFFDRCYLDYKNKLDQICEEKANGIKIS